MKPQKKKLDVFQLGIVMARGIYMACSTTTCGQFLFEDTDSYRHSKHIGNIANTLALLYVASAGQISPSDIWLMLLWKLKSLVLHS
jgi:hypothetical protein